MTRCPSSPARRGAVAPLVALLLVFLVGMIAFSVDIGYVVLVRQELQNAADSAALAGASQLADLEFQVHFAPGQAIDLTSDRTTKARNMAIAFAQNNQGGGKSLTLLNSDITVGYLASPTGSNTLQSSNPPTVLPNTVQVVIRRDTTVTTGSVKLFFAPVLGKSSQDLQATASASISRLSVTGQKVPPANKRGLLLPIALDVQAWNALISGAPMPEGYIRQDEYTYMPETSELIQPNNITRHCDNIPEVRGIYPNKNVPGNFGLVDIGPDANNAPTFWEWITNGPSASDMTYLAANRNGVSGSADWMATQSNPAILKAGPGLKASDESYLKAIIGQTRLMPLFSSVQDNGANATYTVVGLAPLVIVDVELHGSNKHITVQPAPVVDSHAVTTPAGTSITKFIYQPLQLTR